MNAMEAFLEQVRSLSATLVITKGDIIGRRNEKGTLVTKRLNKSTHLCQKTVSMTQLASHDLLCNVGWCSSRGAHILDFAATVHFSAPQLQLEQKSAVTFF